MNRFLTIRADDADWLLRKLTFSRDTDRRRLSFAHPKCVEGITEDIEVQSRLLEALRDAE